MPISARRIVVVGTTGAGKTTMADQLARIRGLPRIELDGIYWGPGWTANSPEVFSSRVEAALSGDNWIVDGNYGSVRDVIWSRADTVVWLDFSLPLILGRLGRRTIRRVLTRQELWNGNRER